MIKINFKFNIKNKNLLNESIFIIRMCLDNEIKLNTFSF